MTNPSLSAQFVEASDRSLMVVLGEGIDIDIHKNVRALTQTLLQNPPPGVIGIHPAYASALIVYDPLQLSACALRKILSGIMAHLAAVEPTQGRIIEIPVCYGGDSGPDLPECSELLGIAESKIVSLHSSILYTVFFLGFAPGFPYLGILPSALAVPRLSSPRTLVPSGSVGIGGGQTGIYPGATPGGWRIIGRTPLTLFNPACEPFTLLHIGDKVRFHPVSEEEYRAIPPTAAFA